MLDTEALKALIDSSDQPGHIWQCFANRVSDKAILGYVVVFQSLTKSGNSRCGGRLVLYGARSHRASHSYPDWLGMCMHISEHYTNGPLLEREPCVK